MQAGGPPRRVVDDALSRGVKVVAVKRGERGAMVGTEHEVFEVPAYVPGPVVDTTGAGLKLRGRGAITSMPSGTEVYAAFESLT